MDAPKLSICIPTWNSAHFLRDSIGSALREAVGDYEIVVVDNASEDDTAAVVASLNNGRIRYFRNEQNYGPHHSANRCLMEARGEYVKFLCADDVFTEGVVAKQLEVLDRHPNVTLTTCNLCMTDSELHPEGVYRCFPGLHSGKRMVNVCLSGLGNYIGGPSALMYRRQDALDITPGTAYKWVADLRHGLKLLEKGDYYNIDAVGYLYRRHANTDTALNCPAGIRVPEYVRLVDEFDWWNPLNCAQALRHDHGGSGSREAVAQRWLRACAPQRVANAACAFNDVRFMRVYGKL